MGIEYTINKCSLYDIIFHLKKCSLLFHPSLDSRLNIEAYAQKIKDHAVTFEAWFEGELAGLIAAYFNDINKQTAYITSVSTIEAFSGKGIGSALLLSCIKYAEAYQFCHLNLRVSKESETAIHLYKKFGFFQIANEESEILMSKKIKIHNSI